MKLMNDSQKGSYIQGNMEVMLQQFGWAIKIPKDPGQRDDLTISYKENDIRISYDIQIKVGNFTDNQNGTRRIKFRIRSHGPNYEDKYVLKDYIGDVHYFGIFVDNWWEHNRGKGFLFPIEEIYDRYNGEFASMLYCPLNGVRVDTMYAIDYDIDIILDKYVQDNPHLIKSK